VRAVSPFDPDLVRRACGDGDLSAIEELSDALRADLGLREARSVREKSHNKSGTALVRSGYSHPDSLINSYVYRMLCRCHDRGFGPPRVLLDVVQIQLAQDRPPVSGERSAKTDALKLIAEGRLSDREIGRQLGIAHTTVGRWRKVVQR